MTQLKKIIQWQTMSGETITVGKAAITPQAQVLMLRLWRPLGGWVWNRPVSVLVEQGGRTERLPIVDITRLVQLSLWGLGLIFSLITLFLSRRQRRD